MVNFFHEFKNKNSEPFERQIDAVLCRIINSENLDPWLDLKYNSDDMIADYKIIIRGLKQRLHNGGKELSRLPG